MTKGTSSKTSDASLKRSAAYPRLHQLRHGLNHWASHFLWPAVVLASLIHTGFVLLKDFEPEAALDMPALVLAHRTSVNLSSSPTSPKDARDSIAVAVIDGDMFKSHFKRRSPLDRCVLTDLLRPIFENDQIETVALDLYAQPNDAEADPCQGQLDFLLQQYPKKAIAIYSDGLPPWPDGTKPSIQFASADFHEVYGVVLKHHVSLSALPALGGAIASRVCSSKAGAAKPEYCKYAHEKNAGFFEGDEKYPSSPIAFEQLKTLHNRGLPIRLDDQCLQGKNANCGIRHVIVGTSYSADDQYLTPVGTIDGVQVHAAIAAQPRIRRGHLWGFAIDIACGALFFGPLSYFFWKRYFASKLQASRRHSGAAYLWLVALCVVYSVAVVMLTYASVHWYAVRGDWISPVPMALGMAFEGMASASVHVALAQLSPHEHRQHGAPPRWSAQRLISALPRLTAISLFLFASLHVLHILH